MKVLVLPRQVVSAAACAAAAAGMFLLVSHPNAVGAAAAQRELPIYAVETEEKRVAISFDAAWGEVRMRRVSMCEAQFMCASTIHQRGICASRRVN